jgi:hypothetical protein
MLILAVSNGLWSAGHGIITSNGAMVKLDPQD